MKIIDLTPKYESTFLACLKDWAQVQELQTGRDHKRTWCTKMRSNGLRVKLAKNENDQVIGMIQYVPVEYARVLGKNLYFIQCTWVHGYEQGMGNMQGQGAGKFLLQTAEDDARALGAKGMVAWELSSPQWTPASWFEKNGYLKVDEFY